MDSPCFSQDRLKRIALIICIMAVMVCFSSADAVSLNIPDKIPASQGVISDPLCLKNSSESTGFSQEQNPGIEKYQVLKEESFTEQFSNTRLSERIDELEERIADDKKKINELSSIVKNLSVLSENLRISNEQMKEQIALLEERLADQISSTTENSAASTAMTTGKGVLGVMGEDSSSDDKSVVIPPS